MNIYLECTPDSAHESKQRIELWKMIRRDFPGTSVYLLPNACRPWYSMFAEELVKQDNKAAIEKACDPPKRR